MLGAPITTAEVQEAIKSLQNCNSPGPDGFTAEYYKSFSNLLNPRLTGMYNEAFALGHLPDTLSEASISLLLSFRFWMSILKSFQKFSPYDFRLFYHLL